jgi:uncharacterized membrane protein YkoI
MKIKRFLALAAIALIVVAGMGAVANRTYVNSLATPAAQTAPCDQQDDDSSTAQNAPDTDNVEEQCGDQNAADDGTDAEAESASEDGVEAAPSGNPAISAEEAKAAAMNAQSGTITQTELDDENGQLVFSVEFDNGADVKVDAMTGLVLTIETGQD